MNRPDRMRQTDRPIGPADPKDRTDPNGSCGEDQASVVAAEPAARRVPDVVGAAEREAGPAADGVRCRGRPPTRYPLVSGHGSPGAARFGEQETRARERNEARPT